MANLYCVSDDDMAAEFARTFAIIPMLLADNSGAVPSGEVAAFAWPGGYPIYYLAADNETFCPKCVNREVRRCVDECLSDRPDTSWVIVARDVNWEDAALFCVHCDSRIESAYAEDEAVSE
jgi:hypothetical protein